MGSALGGVPVWALGPEPAESPQLRTEGHRE